VIPRSWTLPTAFAGGCRRRVSECARCGQARPLVYRGLCAACRNRCLRDGTLAGYGYVKADRMADYAALRRRGEGTGAAGARIGVSARTAQRYEAQLLAAGQAPWTSRRTA
jgi:hypothetical protein